MSFVASSTSSRVVIVVVDVVSVRPPATFSLTRIRRHSTYVHVTRSDERIALSHDTRRRPHGLFGVDGGVW